jgi:hypothetical protein
MKSKRSLVSLLALSLVILATLAFGQPRATAAGLNCSDLRGCGGSAGCASGGTASSCYITCEDGGLITCRSDQGDDDLLN